MKNPQDRRPATTAVGRRTHPALPLALVALAALLLTPVETRAAPHRYALSVFHFNIQYVVGGLIGLFPEPVEGWELDAEQVEDSIILESFEPVLDLYLAHPGWGTNLEMQAYMVEVLADRHPRVLEKLRQLSTSGQVEVVSFHYSDQLFLAYPRSDQERSLERTREVFERHEIPLSRTVFCQEGQASPAMPELMERFGYEYMVWPKNLYRYQHGAPNPAMPHYTFGSRRMVLGPESVNYDDGVHRIEVRWTFLDDGELLSTGGMNPYFAPFFKHDPEVVAEYERKLLDMEAEGFRITTVGRYMQDVQDLGIPAADPPPLLEGTWQPDSTNGIFRWMGAGGIFFGQERDNYVLTVRMTGHRELEAAETVIEGVGRTAPDRKPRLARAMEEAWRLLLLAQVTDASGINPFRGEVDYGIAHACEAIRIARDVIDEGKRILGYQGPVSIDTQARQVVPGEALVPDPDPLDRAPLPVDLYSPGRRTNVAWRQMGTDPVLYRLDIDFFPREGPGPRTVQATFPGDPDRFVYCPALQEEEPVTRYREDFVWEHFILPLANGMIGLGPDRWLIKDTGRVHVGAFVFADNAEIRFRDETAMRHETENWRFYLLEGSVEQAVTFANRLNIRPELRR